MFRQRYVCVYMYTHASEIVVIIEDVEEIVCNFTRD
jgi:hypothetical protein